MDNAQVENMLNQPIAITDAAAMLRHKIRRNEKPYQTTLMKLDNSLIDRWYEQVLVKIADKQGRVPCGKVWPSWLVFLEGVHLDEYIANKHRYPLINEDQVKWWISFFTKATVEDLHNHGVAFVGEGWALLTMAIRHHFAEQKWEKIYSKSKDPREWDRLANENIGLSMGRPLPFNLDPDDWKDTAERVETFFSVKVTPS